MVFGLDVDSFMAVIWIRCWIIKQIVGVLFLPVTQMSVGIHKKSGILMSSISVNYIFSGESENIGCIFNSPSDCGSLWIMLRSSTAPESDWWLAFVCTDNQKDRADRPLLSWAALEFVGVSMLGLCRLHVKASLNKVVNATCSWSGLQTDSFFPGGKSAKVEF